eukprot:TRINITY_DN10942_c0_g1_i1.p2 TRINITY_DN10942_c0_g1~~TRINITY_DN10942_c0_g1_i1.p2  ORF type:complete len:58 (+),score=4.89 TRINITY_DN10942_c0_g1_i1:176-349(+)
MHFSRFRDSTTYLLSDVGTELSKFEKCGIRIFYRGVPTDILVRFPRTEKTQMCRRLE